MLSRSKRDVKSSAPSKSRPDDSVSLMSDWDSGAGSHYDKIEQDKAINFPNGISNNFASEKSPTLKKTGWSPSKSLIDLSCSVKNYSSDNMSNGDSEGKDSSRRIQSKQTPKGISNSSASRGQRSPTKSKFSQGRTAEQDKLQISSLDFGEDDNNPVGYEYLEQKPTYGSTKNQKTSNEMPKISEFDEIALELKLDFELQDKLSFKQKRDFLKLKVCFFFILKN